MRITLSTRVATAIAAALILCDPAPARADLRDHLATAWATAESRAADTVAALPDTSTWPRIGTVSSGVPTGVWTSSSSQSWHAGFWPGQLWLLSQKTDSAVWKQRAEDWSAPLAATWVRDHDIGFIIINSVGKGMLANDDITDPGGTYRDFARESILWGAGILNDRFNKDGVPVGMTKSWDFSQEQPYPVCIDNLMNLELMLLAYELGGPQTYFDNALTHARTSIARHLRADGSTYHVVRHFDSGPDIGLIERKNTRQGYGDETTWTRGQAWAIHGLTTIHRYALRNGDPNPGDLLAAAEAVADYFIAELPHNTTDSYNHRSGDFVPPSDFDAARGEPIGPWNDADNDGVPNETNSGVSSTGLPRNVTYIDDRTVALNTFTLRDTSAAAIAASGLLELAEATRDPVRAVTYRTTAEAILECLITYDSGSDGPDYLNSIGETGNPGILRLGSQLWNDTNRSLIYGDMYFLEALARYEALTARELLETTRLVDTSGLAPAFLFQRHEPAPALMWRIQRATRLEPNDWTTVAWKTGTGTWSGTMPVTELNLGNGKVRVSLDEPVPAPDATYYRVITLSAAGGI